MFFKKRSKPVTQARADMEPAELFKQVASLAKQGLTQKQTAEQLGLKTIFTLNTRLVKSSQATGKPVPAFRQTRKSQVPKWVETVVVKRRGKGGRFWIEHSPGTLNQGRG